MNELYNNQEQSMVRGAQDPNSVPVTSISSNQQWSDVVRKIKRLEEQGSQVDSSKELPQQSVLLIELCWGRPRLS